MVLTGCQLQVDTTISIEADGSGSVTQAVGLDAEAVARIGDLDRQLAVDDLVAAGWTVDPAVREDDGLTWVRAHKEVDDTTELAVAVSELNGPAGPFRDIATGQSDTFFDRTTEFIATYDLTGGPALFTDPELVAVGGDPWGNLIAQVESQTGRPATEMVDFSVTVELPGGYRETWTPSFADAAPTEIAARQSESKVTDRLLQLAAIVALLVLALALRVAWVARRRRTRRMMAGRHYRR